MPRPRSLKPVYCIDKATDRARINGQKRYLGAPESQKSRDAYDRLIGEWIARGRMPVPEPEPQPPPGAGTQAPASARPLRRGPSVATQIGATPSIATPLPHASRERGRLASWGTTATHCGH